VIFAKHGRQGAEIFVMDVCDASTLLTHQVMVGHFLLHLEETARGAQVGLPYQSQPYEELQRAVDGGDIDVGELLLHVSADLFGAHVRAITAEHVPYERSLRRETVAEFVQGLSGVVCHADCESIATAHTCQQVPDGRAPATRAAGEPPDGGRGAAGLVLSLEVS